MTDNPLKSNLHMTPKEVEERIACDVEGLVRKATDYEDGYNAGYDFGFKRGGNALRAAVTGVRDEMDEHLRMYKVGFLHDTGKWYDTLTKALNAAPATDAGEHVSNAAICYQNPTHDDSGDFMDSILEALKTGPKMVSKSGGHNSVWIEPMPPPPPGIDPAGVRTVRDLLQDMVIGTKAIDLLNVAARRDSLTNLLDTATPDHIPDVRQMVGIDPAKVRELRDAMTKAFDTAHPNGTGWRNACITYRDRLTRLLDAAPPEPEPLTMEQRVALRKIADKVTEFGHDCHDVKADLVALLDAAPARDAGDAGGPSFIRRPTPAQADGGGERE